MTDIEILEYLKSYTSKPEVIDRAIEALKAYKPKKPYERFLPCKCGCNRRETWDALVNSAPMVILKCCKCEHSVTGRTYAEAKRNWNAEMEGQDGISN